MQHVNDDVFNCAETVMESDDRDHEGVLVSCNMITNISMCSSKSRTSVREADDEPSLLTNVRGTGGHGGVGDAVLGTVCGGVSGTTNVTGTLEELRLRYRSSRR